MPRKIQYRVAGLAVLLIFLAVLVITVSKSWVIGVAITASTLVALSIAYFLKRYLPEANTVGTLLIPDSGTTFAQQAPIGKNGEVLIPYSSYTKLHRRFIASSVFVLLLVAALLIGLRTVPVPAVALFVPALLIFMGIGLYALSSLLQLTPTGARLSTLKSLAMSDPRLAFARYAPKEASGALKVGYTTYKRLYKFGVAAFIVFFLLVGAGLLKEISTAQNLAGQNFRATLAQLQVVIDTLGSGQGSVLEQLKILAAQTLQPAPTLDEDSLTQKILSQVTKNLPEPSTEIDREEAATDTLADSRVRTGTLKTIQLEGSGTFVIKDRSGNVLARFGEASAITFEEGSIFNIKGAWKIDGTTVTATADELNSLGDDLDTISDASYVVLGASSTLEGERVLTAGSGITITDGGANSTATISLGELAMGTTDTDATVGSVLFAGTGGVLQQDNSSFFWDNVNNRLGLGAGIGEITPQRTLDVRGTSHVFNRSTNDTSTESGLLFSGILLGRATTSGSYNQFAQQMEVRSSVAAGVTNSGSARGLFNNSLRNFDSEVTNDSGTLAGMYGFSTHFGHYNQNPGETPITTNAYGLYARPYALTGTQTNSYGLYLDTKFGSSTITNYYGIYQADTAAKNYFNGNVGIGASPTSKLSLGPSTTSANTAPLKFTSGTLMTTPEAGAVEFLTDKAYLTISTGAARKEFTLNDAALTSGTTPVATTNGRLTDGLILASGTYTPTRSAEANMDGNVTMAQAQYMRVGNTVTVSGKFTADPTLAATTSSFEITLPVSSNIGDSEDVGGTAFSGSTAGMGAEITGVPANDTAKVQWKSSDVASQTWSYTFTYQII